MAAVALVCALVAVFVPVVGFVPVADFVPVEVDEPELPLTVVPFPPPPTGPVLKGTCFGLQYTTCFVDAADVSSLGTNTPPKTVRRSLARLWVCFAANLCALRIACGTRSASAGVV